MRDDEALREYALINGLPGTRSAAAAGDPVAQALADHYGVAWTPDEEVTRVEPMNYRRGFNGGEKAYVEKFLSLRNHVNDGTSTGEPSPPTVFTEEDVAKPIVKTVAPAPTKFEILDIPGMTIGVGMELSLAD